MRFTRFLLLSLAVAGGCAGRTAPAPSAPAVPPKNMLFKVSGRTGPTVYVLGSVHLLSEEGGKLPATVDSAFARAKVVAFEANLDTLQLRGMELLTHARLPAGQTLKDVLSPKTYASLETVAPQYNINIQQLSAFKPWMVGLLMTTSAAAQAKFRAQFGVDFQLHARSKAQGKRILGLESVDLQLNLFNKISPVEQEAMLAAQLVSSDSAVKSLLKIQDAWAQGDTIMLNTALNESLAKLPGVFAVLVKNRNHSWIPPIESMLQGSDVALVVVGAAHLVGPDGVLALLRQKGYNVTAF